MNEHNHQRKKTIVHEMTRAIMLYMPGLNAENKEHMENQGRKTLKKLAKLYLRAINDQHKQLRKDFTKSARPSATTPQADAVTPQYCRKAQ